MKLIWTYSTKLNRSNSIVDEDMLKLYYHSIECGSKFHPTCIYTDSPDKFIGKVDEIVELPPDFELYFLDDIKFFVIENEGDGYTLIDGDLFIDSPIENVSPSNGIEVFVEHRSNIHYEKYNRVLEIEGVKDIIPYWEPSLGYYNLGLVQINNFQKEEFTRDYKKLKQFYKDNIEGVYFNRKEECVEISLCTYFYTLFNLKKHNKQAQLRKDTFTHLCGPEENSKILFIRMLNSTTSVI